MAVNQPLGLRPVEPAQVLDQGPPRICPQLAAATSSGSSCVGRASHFPSASIRCSIFRNRPGVLRLLHEGREST
jgi:hypothetical protein